MKYFYLAFLVSIFAFYSCEKNETEQSRNISKTVIVYMMAENSLSDNSQNDLNEIRSACNAVPEDCDMIVYIDNAYSIMGTTKPALIRYHDDKADTLKVYAEQNSCDAMVLANVLSDIKTASPSASYSLVMWSHGTGWVAAPQRTIGIDNNNNTYSNTGSEMEIRALRETLEKTGMHFGWIFFDACFMQCVEVAYELRKLTDYIIASPAEIPAMGAPYHKVMTSLFMNDNRQAAIAIAQKYYDHYKDNDGLVISVIDTSQLGALATATSPIVKDIPEVGVDDGVQQYCSWSKSTLWRPEYYDMASVMSHYLETAKYEEWYRQIEKTVPLRLYTPKWETGYKFDATITDSEHFAGMSMFVPAERYEPYGHNEAIKQTQWWQDVWGN